jgi:16S rRNA (adenine1518-N6/adenine1519-N6)-dimethyltransferase
MSGSARLLGPADIRRIAGRLEIRPAKRLGQNFVIDQGTIRRIVALAGLSQADVVIEVGPGFGSLTLGLLEAARLVVAVEVDPALAAELPVTVADRAPALAARLSVLAADALSLCGPPARPAPTTLVTESPGHQVRCPSALLSAPRSAGPGPGQAGWADRCAPAGQRGTASRRSSSPVRDRPPGTGLQNVFCRCRTWTRRWSRSPGSRRARRAAARSGSGGGSAVGRAAVFAVVDAAFAQRRGVLRSALAAWYWRWPPSGCWPERGRSFAAR